MLQTGTLAFLAGIVLLQTRAVLPPLWVVYFFPLVIVGLLAARGRWTRLGCCLLAGFLWALFQAHSLLSQRLPVGDEHQNVRVEGTVASLPEYRPGRIQFDFVIDKLTSAQGNRFPRKIRLSWYTEQLPALRPGQVWQLTLRLRTPHSFMDPAAFDYTAWLLQKGIVATGYVVEHGTNRFLRNASWRYPVQVLRYRLQRYLQTVLAGTPTAGLVCALIIGDRNGISQTQWQVLQQTGTVHLVAISGLHIGLIAGMTFFVVVRLWCLLPRLCLRLPAPKAAAALAWLVAWFYAALAGFAIPTQRALIMLAVILLSLWLQRSYKPSQVIALALLLVLAWDPLSVLAVGFWLSFGAVAFIYYILQFRTRHTTRFSRWWRMQWAISLGLLPLVIAFFQQVPVISPVSNLIAIPWISLVVLPAALLSTFVATFSPGLGAWGLHLVAAALQWLQAVLAWMMAWQGNLIHLPAPGIIALILAMLGIAVMLLPRQMPARYLGLLCCLPLLFPAIERPAPGAVRLSLLDVGQGLSAVVQTARHTLIFDTGPRYSPVFDAGQAVILPYLHHQGITEVDTLLLSHSDLDHIGGALSILDRIPVRQVVSNVATVRRGLHDRGCWAGQAWQWDGVDFRILYPSHEDYAEANKDNNRSCVLQITSSTQRLLLTADIEYPAEAVLVARYGKKLRSDVLVIPHHGSKTSSTSAFLAAVNPSLALIPAGWHNRFHLPAGTVVARLRTRPLHLLNTASAGAIVVDTGRELQVRSYRQQYRRYWQVW